MFFRSLNVKSFKKHHNFSISLVFWYSLYAATTTTITIIIIIIIIIAFFHPVTMIMVEFVWFPHIPTELLVVLQFPRPSFSKNRRGCARQTIIDIITNLLHGLMINTTKFNY